MDRQLQDLHMYCSNLSSDTGNNVYLPDLQTRRGKKKEKKERKKKKKSYKRGTSFS